MTHGGRVKQTRHSNTFATELFFNLEAMSAVLEALVSLFFAILLELHVPEKKSKYFMFQLFFLTAFCVLMRCVKILADLSA